MCWLCEAGMVARGEFTPRRGGLLEEKISQSSDEVWVDACGGGALVVETGFGSRFSGLGV